MNIIGARQQQRMQRIEIIKASILKSKDPDLKFLVMKCMADWGMSERMVKEYLKVAQFNIDNI